MRLQSHGICLFFCTVNICYMYCIPHLDKDLIRSASSHILSFHLHLHCPLQVLRSKNGPNSTLGISSCKVQIDSNACLQWPCNTLCTSLHNTKLNIRTHHLKSVGFSDSVILFWFDFFFFKKKENAKQKTCKRVYLFPDVMTERIMLDLE